MKQPFSLARGVFAALLALLPSFALAHGDEPEGAQVWWQNWSFDAEIWALAILFLWLFVRGARRSTARARPVPLWRGALYVAGVALIWAALETPLDYLAEHLFWMHQVQHMILHLAGPLLVLAAAPQAVVFSGMPRGMRRWTILPLALSPGARGLGRFLITPAVATTLYILTLVVWEIPAWHDAALLNDALHYVMHMSMLLAGVLFFWVLFDLRDPPKGVNYGVRLVMLVAAGVTAIVVGSITTFKPVELYPAYDVVGRLFDWQALPDEATGGFLIWVPSAMMLLLAMLMVVTRWNGSEDRQWTRHRAFGSNSAALLIPETAEELWMLVETRNMRLGLGLGAVSITMFLMVMGVTEALHVAAVNGALH